MTESAAAQQHVRYECRSWWLLTLKAVLVAFVCHSKGAEGMSTGKLPTCLENATTSRPNHKASRKRIQCTRGDAPGMVRVAVRVSDIRLREKNISWDAKPFPGFQSRSTKLWHIHLYIVDFMVNVGKYTIHWSYVSGKLNSLGWDHLFRLRRHPGRRYIKISWINLAPWHPEPSTNIYELEWWSSGWIRLRLQILTINGEVSPFPSGKKNCWF